MPAILSFCYTWPFSINGQQLPFVITSKTMRSFDLDRPLMNSLLRKIPVILMSVAAAAISIAAQKPTPTPRPTPGDDNGTTKVFEVRLPVTVTDKKKNLVTGLARGDFQVLEDGVPQEVTFFSDEKTNPPVFVGVLMDTSPSTAGKLSFEKEAAANFIYTVLQLRKDKAAFMTFDNEINLRQDFTDKLDLLQKEPATAEPARPVIVGTITREQLLRK